MNHLVELMADALAKEPMPTPHGGFYRVGKDIGKFTMNTNPQVDTFTTDAPSGYQFANLHLSAWNEWKPPQFGMLRAIGRARLGVMPWCLLAICHAWDERQAKLAAIKASPLDHVVITQVDHDKGTYTMGLDVPPPAPPFGP